MENLFAYGTLMCEDIIAEVTGCCLSSEPVILRGYIRLSVKGEHYPAIVRDEKSHVKGVVYRNLQRSAWDRLDRFEGEIYIRHRVQIELKDNTCISADTYVINPDFLHKLDKTEWIFSDFLRKSKERFQKDYKGYREL